MYNVVHSLLATLWYEIPVLYLLFHIWIQIFKHTQLKEMSCEESECLHEDKHTGSAAALN